MRLAPAGLRRLVRLKRTPQRAAALADVARSRAPACHVVVCALSPAWSAGPGSDLDPLVTTTSVGLHPGDPAAVDGEPPPASTLAYDLVYRPGDTALLTAARRRGCRAVNGRTIFLHQAARALGRWTGRGTPRDAMRRGLRLSWRRVSRDISLDKPERDINM